MHGVNEARVKLWIKALRSGEYTQANGWLETLIEVDGKRVTGNCCLGVAQHVALNNGWHPDRGLTTVDWGQASMDPDAARWFGFGGLGSDPLLRESGDAGPVFCIQANDDLDWDFNQIADALEARYITPQPIEQES